MESSPIFANIFNMSSAREIIFELMERACHDTIGQIECLLNAVTVMDIDVDVQDSLVGFEQLEDG